MTVRGDARQERMPVRVHLVRHGIPARSNRWSLRQTARTSLWAAAGTSPDPCSWAW